MLNVLMHDVSYIYYTIPMGFAMLLNKTGEVCLYNTNPIRIK